MEDIGLLAPRFVIIHYFIKWFIKKFGLAFYCLVIVLPLLVIALYTLRQSAKGKEWDRVLMIVIFMLIALGGLIGLGFDIHNGYSMVP
ncbi:hypothetical protein [Natronincola ferrireducens]|uniref:Uncharacterized protein n=1 Tax=Natronincola ferrireducens TaxID=393762 RepID=A0A1G9FF23_9FIRM|nr:hypothetical protein [Natronincola ferrireducens]SDK86964.1 hypothetical protein SAMN05660472_02172 [Natronincola ferrireducens]